LNAVLEFGGTVIVPAPALLYCTEFSSSVSTNVVSVFTVRVCILCSDSVNILFVKSVSLVGLTVDDARLPSALKLRSVSNTPLELYLLNVITPVLNRPTLNRTTPVA